MARAGVYQLAACLTRASAVAVALMPGASYAQEDERARQAYDVLKANCFECHGEKKRAGLDLRTYESLKQGGDTGPVVVPHDPAKSRLYLAVTHQEEPFMPNKRPKLADADLEILRAWIDDGASLEAVDEATDTTPEAAPATARNRVDTRPITPEERRYWAFIPPRRPELPRRPEPPGSLETTGRPEPLRRPESPRGPEPTRPAARASDASPARQVQATHPIDAFLRAALDAKGLTPAKPASRRALIRRAYLDVLGLLPSPNEVEQFVNDRAPDAWPRLVDRLLASPHYGERWARHWLDLVRYADSGGFEFDVDRREGWRYRDYVVKAFNADKPYDEFIREQIAGDEYAPDSEEALVATGFLRLGPESGGGERGRQEALDDVVATTSLTFMGLTVSCARCHNHKFDPIAQKDYYRMQAVFASTRNVEHPLVPSHVVDTHKAETARIDAQQRPLRQQKRELEAPHLAQLVDRAVDQLPEYLQTAWRTPPDQRTAGQKLNVAQIEKTLQNDSLRAKIAEKDIVALMSDEQRQAHAALKARIDELDAQKPAPYATARAVREEGRTPRPTYFLFRGSIDAKGPEMTPGPLTVLTASEESFAPPPAAATSSWRRRAFAEWLTSPDHPLTARVMVNRLWQHHFGEGLVRTPSNFGDMGERPSHPELLDWLATEFVARGWSVKAMHRLMLTSRAYQMSSDDDAANVAIDPENRLFWRMPRLRNDAETIRDQILATAGTLDRTFGGPGIFPYIDPDLFEASSKRNWPGKPDTDPSTWRRSLYVFSKRSIRYPMFEAFDQPNLINSVDRRNRSTVAPQALILMNNAFVLTQAGRFAERLAREAGPRVEAQVARAFRLALGRAPDATERTQSVAYVRGHPDGLAGFCHVLFNLNEFVYRP